MIRRRRGDGGGPQGSNRGDAGGFGLETLSALMSFKSAELDTTLMHHLARVAFQPGRILVSYGQVTSQLGSVLDVSARVSLSSRI